ncbi:MAG TPA: tetratricopeptide repeat protein [Pyrinomonadaceae bacterium]|nr:tetratricopeptide repeat protein [Pyrinomonadaceae bacterium]
MSNETPSAAASGFARAQAARAPRGRAALFFLTAALAAAALSAPRAAAQVARPPISGPESQHIIFGEVRIDESKVEKDKGGVYVPDSFELILATEGGRVIERRSVMSGTSFRFGNLSNGGYELIIESDRLPVARVRVFLDSPNRIEHRQDIRLAWDPSVRSKSDPKKGVVSAADYYERPAATRDAFERAAAAIKKKKFSDAAALLRQVVVADPKDHLAWAHLGSVHTALGQSPEAEQAYERALALRPDLTAAAANLGRLYVIGKNYGRAVELLAPVAARRPDSADVHHLLGEAYMRTGKPDDAVTHFREALRLDPTGKANAHLGLAAIHDAAGNKDKAAAELEQFLSKRPDHPDRNLFEQYVKENKKN